MSLIREYNKNSQLVSIVVITYNSAKFILETLESIHSQTYSNIELIISDDFSLDNTIEICEEFIAKNKSRFVNVTLLRSTINYGISANCNNGIKVAHGEWIRILAGDDILISDSIENQLEFINNSNEIIDVLTGYQYSFKDNIAHSIINLDIDYKFYDIKTSPHEQYKMLLEGNRVQCFPMIRKRVLDFVGGFNEKYRFLEDYPLWFKLTENEIKISCCFMPVVYYRIHDNNISNLIEKNYIVRPFIKHLNYFKMDYIIKRVGFLQKMVIYYEFLLCEMIFKFGNNSQNLFLLYFYKIFTKFNPFKVSMKLLNFYK